MPRKKAFSHKQKKVQLQQKRERKRVKLEHGAESERTGEDTNEELEDETSMEVDKVHEQPVREGATHNPNKYRLHFERESKEEIERRKTLAKKQVIKPVGQEKLEVCVDEIYRPGSVLDIPRRPPWTYEMTKAEVEGQEEAMFKDYLQRIYSSHKAEELSYFEHNIETWRQLWRVLEISDVILLITDIRHPALHFSPALYKYIVTDLKKQLVLVLNKVDLVPPQVAVAWRHYFISKFPQLNVICFTSYPNSELSTQPSTKVHLKFRKSGGKLPSAVGPTQLLSVVSEMYRDKVDTRGWRDQRSSPTPPDADLSDLSSEDSPSEGSDTEEGEECEITTTTVSSDPLVRDSVSKGVLTLGLVGHPNVGKSSIINGLLHKKAVSTSRTPGHTKHFQTVFLSPTLRLCDCPGLVFPSLVERQLQVLSGVYPVAQVREPYTAVGYVAARLPIVELLDLKHPNTIATVFKKTKGRRTGDFELDEPYHVIGGANHVASFVTAEPQEWTAWDVCDAWAEKRGYYTARGAGFDTYRAANSLLRLVVDGRICLCFVPPGFTKDKDMWTEHSEVGEMLALQSQGMGTNVKKHTTTSVTTDQEQTVATCNKFSTLTHIDD